MRGEETLGHAVVVRIADAAHRLANVHLLAALALIALTDHAMRPTLRGSHVQGGAHQICVQRVADAQDDDPADPGIVRDRQ